MAPEIIKKKEFLGPPVDVWALGVVLYVMIYGVYPFKGANDAEMGRKICGGHVETPNGPSKA
jgi:serine/threonine protein kinase